MGKQNKLKVNRYSTMHKAKINFSKAEGLENTSFCFEDHLFLKKNGISLICKPLSVL